MKAKTRMSVSSDHTTYIKCCWTFDLFRKKMSKILFWVIKLFFKVTENKNVQVTSPSYLCLKVTRTFSGVSFFTLVQYVQQRLQCIMYTVLAAPLASTPDSDFANLCVSQQLGIKHVICKLPAALNHHFPSFFSQLLRRQHPVQLV